jgi:type IV pilus assembly protein PilV
MIMMVMTLRVRDLEIFRMSIIRGSRIGFAALTGRSPAFTLVEILVTLIILAVGLLGLAGLMFEGMRNNQGSYLRTQASIYAYDISDRMRANRERAQLGDYAGADGFSTADLNSLDLPACASAASGCSPADRVGVDQVEWARQVRGTGNGVPMIPGGVGTIDFDATENVYTINIEWVEGSRGGDAGEAIANDNSFELRFEL